VPWGLEDPAAIHQSREALEVVQSALSGLPASQRQVVLLRDVEDVPARDVCNILELTETNQRVLLHRGRARIRRALDRYVREGSRPRSRVGNGRMPVAPTRGQPGTGQTVNAPGFEGDPSNASGGSP